MFVEGVVIREAGAETSIGVGALSASEGGAT